jgi:serine/threonine protein kinase
MGEGGQGVVYKSNEFAVKKIDRVIDELIPENSMTLEWFVSEIGYNFKVCHPNILEITAWAYDDKCYYIASRLGKSLYDHECSIDEYLSSCLSAILYLETMKIRHRDIKRSNLIYVDGMIKLIDFGVACDRSKGSFKGELWSVINMCNGCKNPLECENLKQIESELIRGINPLSKIIEPPKKKLKKCNIAETIFQDVIDLLQLSKKEIKKKQYIVL